MKDQLPITFIGTAGETSLALCLDMLFQAGKGDILFDTFEGALESG